ncbi:hypothetical protein ACJX0J_016410, partial [Zea mays]
HTIVILRVKNEMDRNTAIQSQIEPDPDQKGTQNQHYGVVGIHGYVNPHRKFPNR